MEIPQRWAEYARLQARSSRNLTIDSYSWGTEEEMNLFLSDPDGHSPAESRHLSRVNAAAARRERSRAIIRKRHEADLAPRSIDVTAQREAREALTKIRSRVTIPQWDLLLAVGQGEDYREIGLKMALSTSAARSQIFRLRQQLLDLRPAA